MGYVILGIIIVVLVGVLVWAFFRGNTAVRLEKDKAAHLKERLAQQEKTQCLTFEELVKVRAERDQLSEDYDEAVSFCRSLENNLEQYKNREWKEESEEGLDKAIAEKQASIDRLKEVSVQYEEVAAQIKELMEEKLKIENGLEKAKSDYSTAEMKVRRIMERYQVALKVEDKKVDGWTFDLSKDEVRLIELIGEISSMYKELREDLAIIEWKKIWLPKLQDLNGKVGLEKRGIYCLEVKGSDGICYVGQAVNIKERWYQHVKKMIGAMPKGNEKLYKFRPEDIIWKILVSGNDIDLNEEERFWIDNLKCKEVGLNRI